MCMRVAYNALQAQLAMFARLDTQRLITVLLVIQDIMLQLILHLLVLYVLPMLISIVCNVQAHLNALLALLDGQVAYAMDVLQVIVELELVQLAFQAIFQKHHTVDHAPIFMLNASPALFQLLALLVRLDMMLTITAESAQQVTIQILIQEL